MQHSADFTSLLAHQADVARAERELELRRAIDERRALGAVAGPDGNEPTRPARRRVRALRMPRFTLRRA